ncbi:MAG: glucuronyl hydrolase [Candidatus Neomarinimicrobiota bacterium]
MHRSTGHIKSLIPYLFLAALFSLSCFSRENVPKSPDELLGTASAIYLPLSQTLSPEQGYPRSIVNGLDWHLTPPEQWTSGFFPGILWQLYQYTGNPSFSVQARRWTEGLETQQTAPTHDVGFMINNSFGHGYRVGGIERYKTVVLDAAQHLASRFNARVGAIRSWDGGSFTYPVIIDNMMNLELLFWAARNSADSSLAELAQTHALTTIRDHVRANGSTFHVVDYQPETGEVIWRGTHQGWADSSTWARGQAWGLYGFTVAYRETREPVFLETACRLADRFLERLPEDGIPYWDFDAPHEPEEPKDASAAAIAASGLWTLATLVDQAVLKRHYRAASKRLVESLSSSWYSAVASGLPALLLHSTGDRPHNIEVNVPMIYADYYFIEALMKQASK